MRSDIDRLLVLRPRHGSHRRNDSVKRARSLCSDELPRRERMRPRDPRVSYKYLELSEYFSPLVRFLRARVNHKWDNVYSELRRVVKLNSTTQYHVLQHVPLC
jgi:hypothetical protein